MLHRLFYHRPTIIPRASKVREGDAREPFRRRPSLRGGAVGAQAGKLSFMFGTDVDSEGLVDYLKSVLLLMGTKAWHMGGQGCGVSAKLANNYILAINNIAVSEALNMGREWGLDLHKLTELINSSRGHCWPVEVNNSVPGVVQGSPASKEYTPGCPVSMINKDLGLAMSGASDAKTPLLLAETAREAYNKVDGEYQGQDFSVVYQYLSRRSSA
ncbi:uncharacterized protein TrAtP1_011956 [Trichoderma atroviride]|uniref:uncharacterized protein n=1 Tax=Hypocrea atroviridis TaxID=63577 RepID=UPI00331DE875|nr:hypothetical protein TrAtP1_011956 [Trichoderma atroviride]